MTRKTKLDRRKVRGLRIKVCLPDSQQEGGLAQSGGRRQLPAGPEIKGECFAISSVFERRETKEEKEERLRSLIPPLTFISS